MMAVKKNDTVVVITGRDKGKKGVVIDILPKKGKVMIQGVNLVVRHAKARKQGDVSGIKKEESFLDLSNVMPVCTSCKLPSRINSKIEGDRRARVCNRCKEIF